MLEALEKGVGGGRWYSLMDKVIRTTTLRAAFEQVRRNKGAAGTDHQTIGMFEHRLESEVEALAGELRTGTYRPRAVRRAWIPKPGSVEKRPLGIPAVRDRVVQTALRMVLEPIFERDFAAQSYGFRPGRGCKDALRRVDELLGEGFVHVVDADLKGYFDTIPHGPLKERVAEKVADGAVLDLVGKYLDADVMDGTDRWTPERGSPQGAVISPLLSNIYLDPLDREMAAKGFEMVRYADDFVVLCRSAEEAAGALETVRLWTAQAGLTLHPDKTRVVDATQRGGFDFLGYHFERGRKYPRQKSLQKFRDTVRQRTRRTNGTSLRDIIDALNPMLRGWFEYFKHSRAWILRRTDGWVRMRLRSILRWRAGRRGRARGTDHQRWTNDYFAGMGLFRMEAAHALALRRQPRPG
jgi:RNA-directed DNA polymerase